jgi:hypothetical protein
MLSVSVFIRWLVFGKSTVLSFAHNNTVWRVFDFLRHKGLLLPPGKIEDREARWGIYH